MLYKLPSVPARGKTLELLVSQPSVLTASPWLGREIAAYSIDFPSQPDTRFADNVADTPAARLPFPDNSFDIVVLHQTIDELADLARRKGKDFHIPAFMAEVARVLTPGGVATGCVGNRHSIKLAIQRIKFCLGLADGSGIVAPPPLSSIACRQSLLAAGFADSKTYTVEPGADSPQILHEIEPGWPRRAALWHVEKARPNLSRPSYWLWRFLAELGISQWLTSTVYFWAKKC